MRGMPRAIPALCSLRLLTVLVLLAPAAAAADAGIELEIERATSSLRARDVGAGEDGPVLRVVMGSPGQPTPSGLFPVSRVVLNPGWTPGEAAREAGAEAEPPSLTTPMGVAKIPFADGGSIALHGAGDARLLGRPVSSGCVRATDADLLLLLAWLHEHGALGPPVEQANGEIVRAFQRPVAVAIR